MSEQPKALGRPYDDSRDQPLPPPPGTDEWPSAGKLGAPASESAGAPARPSGGPTAGTLADRIKAVEQAEAGAALPARAGDLPQVEITNEAEAGVTLHEAINARVLPNVYRRHGRLVVVDELDHMPTRRGIAQRAGRHLVVRDVEPATMRRLLGRHTFTYVLKKESRKVDAKLIPVRAAPSRQLCHDVLDSHSWPGLPALAGVTTSPVLRPDGSLVQTVGYDESTSIYYAPALQFDPVPARPSEAEVREAREFVLNDVLGDFPWVDKADLANYLGLLVAPVLRTMSGTMTPLGAITAASAGTGKTLLAGDIPAALYGLTSRPWVDQEDEVRKSISTILVSGTKPVVLFDNVPEWRTVDSPMLAKLLTSASWDDRLLGGNEAVEVDNDRLWLVTGNSMTFGGDMPPRTVLVRLDAKVARPDLRDPSEFKIGNLQAWLTDQGNAAELLRRLLILIADWVAAGAPEGNYVMRQFTPWARAAGGFLDHHGVHGFLANRAALDAADEETTEWVGFCHMWHTHFSDAWRTPSEAAASAHGFATGEHGEPIDPWRDQYPRDRKTGRLMGAVQLGRRLSSKIGRIFPAGDVSYRIDRLTDPRSGQNRYRVQRQEPAPTHVQPSLLDHDPT